MVDSTNLPEVDINAIATDLNNKVDKDGTNAEFIHIIEAWHDANGNWYRIYSDGWCEQGGIVNVNYNQTTVDVLLLKPYIDTNYSILLTAGGAAVNGVLKESWQNKTVSQFAIYGDYSSSTALNIPTTWRASGYIR